jgi:hypothetical protein
MEYKSNDIAMWIPTNWNSIFIPALPSDAVDEDFIKKVVEDTLQLGKVKRVDLSLKQNHKNKYMAFVHFDYWMDTENVHNFRNIIESYGYNDVYGINVPKTSKEIYMRFMVNKTPIKETSMNAHQLAASIEMAEAKIQDQDNIINDLLRDLEDAKSLIDTLNDQIRKMKNNDNQYKTPYIDMYKKIPDLERGSSFAFFEEEELDTVKKVLF